MGYFESGYERVTLEFHGSIAGTFLRLSVQWIFSQLILPTAWGTAIVFRWVVKHIRFSDGTKATFEGRPGQVWGWLALSAGIGYVPVAALIVLLGNNPFVNSFDTEEPEAALGEGDSVLGAVFWALTFLVLPVVLYVELVIYRWAIAGVRLDGGPVLSFTGRYLPMVGWALLTILGSVTIFGWAWVGTAYLRWFTRKIQGAGIRFEFVGSGWGLLWRLFPAFLLITMSGAIATLAWWAYEILWFIVYSVSLIWSIKWATRNTVVLKATTSKGAALTGTSPPPRSTTPPPARESPPPRSKTPTPKPKSPAPKKPTPPPADPPPDVPFPLIVEIKSG